MSVHAILLLCCKLSLFVSIDHEHVHELRRVYQSEAETSFQVMGVKHKQKSMGVNLTMPTVFFSNYIVK